MSKPSSDVAFTDTVKRIQEARGSRAAYERMERAGGFETYVTSDLVAWLARIDTAFLATVNREGNPYVQHRGGPKGFLRKVDDRTIGFLDLSGNRQYVTTGNLEDDGRICIIAIDYATRRRVKIWGRARTVDLTPELLRLLAPPGYAGDAEHVVLVTVEAWDRNCPKHIPQKIDAKDVAEALARLEARITELEEENRELRAELNA